MSSELSSPRRTFLKAGAFAGGAWVMRDRNAGQLHRQDYAAGEAATGRCATYVVAAATAPDHVKAQADFICDGVDDQVEIQAAMDALSAGGGNIKLTEGAFELTDSIIVDPNSALIGAGIDATTMNYSGSSNGIKVRSTSSDTQSVVLRGFALVGTVGGSHGLYMPGAKNWRIIDLKIRGFTGSGVSSIYLSGNEGAGQIGCFYKEFYGAEVRGSDYGITLTGVESAGQSNANKWYGGKFQTHAVRAINIEAPATGNVFFSPSIEDCATLIYSNGRANVFYAPYMESFDATFVEFGANSTWNAVFDMPTPPSTSTPVDDNGIQNAITIVRHDGARKEMYGGVVQVMSTDGNVRLEKDLTNGRYKLNAAVVVGPATTITIAAGVVTVTGSYHTVDTEGSAASDDLDTINGGVTGQLLVLNAINSARTVVMKNGTGNISLAGSDFVMDHRNDRIMLQFDAAGAGAWVELSRSKTVSSRRLRKPL
ncbi:MAG: hypothetical protein GEU78_15420 [Actinobacteria bacterium]|nr:hypothetical protein [Actinomycetota bacterium]